jgi:hypothetical protein
VLSSAVRAVFAFCKRAVGFKTRCLVHAAETQQFHGFLYAFGEVQRVYTIHSAGVIGRSRTFDLAMEQQFVASVIAVKETRHNIDNAGVITVAVDTLASSNLPKEQKIKLAGRVRSGLTIVFQRSDVACSLAVRRSQVVTIHETATC